MKVSRSSVDGLLGVAHARDLGDVAGEVAHALEVTRHAHGGDDRAQVARDRGLSGEQVDRAGVEVVAAVVDGPIALDDPVGELHVRLEEGLGRLADRGGDEPGQLDEVARDLLELVVEDLAHGVPFVGVRGQVPGPVNAVAVNILRRAGEHRGRSSRDRSPGVSVP